MSSLHADLWWRSLRETDLPSLTDLAQACLAADGGQPFAASPDFLRRTYLSGAETYAGLDGADLICVSALSSVPDAAAVTTGLVHPAWRRRGVGGHAFDWAAERAGNSGIRAATEALSAGGHALYLARGLEQVFAEDVMQLPAAAAAPTVAMPDGLDLTRWGEADPARFYAVYAAAFRERPGFPGWSEAQWIEWISDDEDFRPRWTLLATLAGTDVGFIVGEATGWIAQVGVVPSARGKAIGAGLVAEVIQQMRSAGETSIALDVNVNNPHAAALYRRLGFAVIGQRARYEAAERGRQPMVRQA